MSSDISCIPYNNLIQENINNIARNSENLRTWTRENSTNPNYYISSCYQQNRSLKQQLLNKKKYVYGNANSNTNKTQLTKAQKYSRAARGFTPNGQVSKQYGTQTISYTNSFYLKI